LSITFYTAILALVEPSSRVCVRDVAPRADVSVVTVSNAVSRQYGVAAGPSAVVRAILGDLGDAASRLSLSLRDHRTNMAGILVARLEPFRAGPLRAAADAMHHSSTKPGADSACRGQASDTSPITLPANLPCGRPSAPTKARSPMTDGLR
jgi:hypothetical protein